MFNIIFRVYKFPTWLYAVTTTSYVHHIIYPHHPTAFLSEKVE